MVIIFANFDRVVIFSEISVSVIFAFISFVIGLSVEALLFINEVGVVVVMSFSVKFFDDTEAVVIVERGLTDFLSNCVLENDVVEDGVVKIDVDTDERDAEDALISSSTTSLDTKI